MSQDKIFNRYFVMIGAIVAQLCLGSIYAWTVFQTALYTPVVDGGLYGWEKLLTQLPFSIGLASFAFFMIFAGRLQDRVGPTKIATIGGILLGAGYILAGLIDIVAPIDPLLGFLWLAITYGGIGGAGIGFAYVCPIAALVKWFPDIKGLITGIAVAGFGMGAFFLIYIEDFLIASIGQGLIGSTFFILGISFLVLVVGAAQVLRNPPEGWIPAGYKEKAITTVVSGKKDYNPREMISSPEFWLLWSMFVLAASAGLMTLGNVKTFSAGQLTSAGISTTEAAVLASTIGSILAVLNAFGRIFWGAVSDRLGRTVTMIIMFTTLGTSMIFFSFQSDFLLLLIGGCLIGLCFGGNFALFPSSTADYFGTKNLGINYGLVFTAYGVAGIFGPFLAGILPYADVFPLLGLLAFIAVFLAVVTELLNRRKAQESL